MLRRAERVWTSDCNDALERQAIQRGASLLIPPEVMGAHIGPTRAHTTGRSQSLPFRALTALWGHLGVEWNLLELDPRELQALAAVIAVHKRFRPLLHSGSVVRFDPVLNGVHASSHAHGVYASDLGEALVAAVQLTTGMSLVPAPLRLPGLLADATYRIEEISLGGGRADDGATRAHRAAARRARSATPGAGSRVRGPAASRHDGKGTLMTASMIDYEFDLRGFVVVRGALSAAEVQALNDAYDRFPELDNGDWYGNAQRRDYTKDTGFELHNVLDCGDPAFDVLIDHPAWLPHVRHWAGEEGTYVQGVTIDEHVATSRSSGGHHPVHSGGHDASARTQYSYRNGAFRCGQVNVLVALRDIGPGDGPTMIVPGSHKSNFMHPLAGDYFRGDRMDALPFAEEVHAEAGDALLFVDACMHGGSTRVQRRRAPGRHPAIRTAVGAAAIRIHPVAGAPRPAHTRSPTDHAADRTAAQGRDTGAHRPALLVPVRGLRPLNPG